MNEIVLNSNNSYAKNRRKGNILSILFSRMLILVFLVVLQIYTLYLISVYIDESSDKIIIFLCLSIFITIIIVNSKKIKNSYKIIWLFLFSFTHIFGFVIYLMIKLLNYYDRDNKKLRDNVLNSKKHYINTCKDYYDKVLDNVDESFDFPLYVREHFSDEKTFLRYFINAPELYPYINTHLKYFDNGKDAFIDILTNMKNAKKFIFIEIFILSDGIIWQEMLKILKEKAKEGVVVRLMFDGLNSISSFKNDYCDELKKYGIEAKMYKPLVPIISNAQNSRDHRKIFVIDNEIAYTGGINIADEYANLYERFGIWKDVGIKITGNAVESFTIMFLQMWNVYVNSNIVEYEKFLPKYENKITNNDINGIVVPYTDYPGFTENVSLEIFKYMFNNANKKIYIMTPYLVIDESLLDTLEFAAKRDVDVKIIVPHIPDKKYVFMVNRSYYRSLTNAGVKVYEYLPGFVHAKVIMQDNIRAVVGTCNLDFRSLYLHVENGVYMFGAKNTICDINRDFTETLKDCREMTHVEINKIPVSQKIFGAIFRMFAPLL